MAQINIHVIPRILKTRVVGLRGLPGDPSQEQVNIAVEEYMTEHPEAQIPDGAVSTAKLADGAVTTPKLANGSVTELKIADEAITTEKMASNTVAPYASELVSSSYTEDSTPYLFRKTFAGVREDTEIVGGSVVWNQLIENGDFADGIAGWRGTRVTRTVADGVMTGTCNEAGTIYLYQSHGVTSLYNHVCMTSVDCMMSVDKLVTIGLGYSSINTNQVGKVQVTAGQWTHTEMMYRPEVSEEGFAYRIGVASAVNVDDAISIKNVFLIDLTLMFGPTVADYIYSLEQETAGAGVAFFRSLFSKPYYPYNEGEIVSVNTSAHKMTSEDGTESVTYPLSSIDLRGIPTIVDGKLKYDGDIYKSDGTVTRRYGIVDLGTLTWSMGGASFASNTFSSQNIPTKAYGNVNFVANGYTATDSPYLEMQDKTIRGNATGNRVYIRDTAYADATAFKTAMSGVYLVYELATPTTETAEPFTNPQVVYPGGTEEYIDERDIPVPVGHNTKYMRDIKRFLEDIPDAPTATGTYTLKAVVTSGGVTYSWVEG